MNQYPSLDKELSKKATYFVSFWWSIFWQEALVLGATLLIWQAGLYFISDSLWIKIVLSLLTLIMLPYFLTELIYTQLEKHYLRKNFKMICVDKQGKAVEPTIMHARAVFLSFLWAHLFVLLLLVLLSFFFTLFSALWFDLSLFALFWALLKSLYSPLILFVLALIFAIYPHYWIWSRSFYNLAGIRFALIEYP